MIYGGLFDLESKDKKIEELEKKINQPDFYNDKQSSEKVFAELNLIKSIKSEISLLKNDIESSLEILTLMKSDIEDDIKKEIEENVDSINNQLKELELSLLLNDKHDKLDCIIDIHPGAGGLESCDWASMLYRMYTRWCEKNNKKVELLDYQAEEEAGIKSVSFIVHGLNSYGYLKNEKGVHRLIRLSPFDSNNRRHTSFASVDVTPIYQDKDITINIKDSDLRIDVYRSSGKGGQVNTTDSAVRITHLPTKIVVTCQNERSQIRNKEIAMNVLKNKLYQLEIERKEQELKQMKGINADINFGSQIRTYTMHPYSLVKDHRTLTETSMVDKVLDGDLDIFIYDNLKRSVK